ncbi:MAG TPA: hypothetical protein VK524_26205 [Polyangiaceae bacterium]|nr:hypothetical protein [Polyangiaceae bacterium]
MPTAVGPANTLCEKDEWLVMAPTRAEFSEEGATTTQKRDDGAGLYRVGSSDPESIPALSDEFPDSEMVHRHRSAVKGHDDKRLLAASLGAAGVIALGVGTLLFVSSFETKRSGSEESQELNGGRALASGLVFAGGFGLGIAGIAVNPSQAERSRADASRHVFFGPEDDPSQVQDLVVRHNKQVRERCERTPSRP